MSDIETLEKVEYLTAQSYDPFHEFSFCEAESLLEEGFVYSPLHLIQCLEAARECLVRTPGENQFFRQLYGETWMNWWICFLSTIESPSAFSTYPLQKAYNVITFLDSTEMIYQRSRTEKGDFGVWFVANLEGLQGHRFAVKYCLQIYLENLMIVFEKEEYTEKFKPRGGSFLDLGIRISMWSHFLHHYSEGDKGVLTISPTTPKGRKDFSEYYRDMFAELGAAYCFAKADDSMEVFMDKIRRGSKGVYSGDFRIPITESPYTSEIVRV